MLRSTIRTTGGLGLAERRLRAHWAAFEAPTPTIGVKAVTWTGDGTASQSVTVGFAPKFALAGRDLGIALGLGWTTSRYINTDALSGLRDAGSTFITSLDANGFTVGLGLNAAATVYYGVAFGNTVVDTGEYTGDTTDNRNITTAVDPIFAFVGHNDNATRTGIMNWTGLGDASQNIGGYGPAGAQVDYIQSLGAKTFQVGTTINASGKKYGWFVFGLDATNIALADYTGDDTNPRTFTVSLPRNIEFVLTQSTNASTMPAAARTVHMAANNSVPYPNVVQAGNILSFSAGTNFTTDASIRVNSSTRSPYRYWAFCNNV